jgi:chemotaxis protein CheX
MNVKFLNPFVEAAFEVLPAEAGVSLVRGELALDKHPYVTDDVTVILSLVGQVQGTVFYSMAATTALEVSSRMLGERLTQLDGLAQSGVAELGNVITGRASVKLAEAGYESTISPPTLLVGRGARISTLDFARLIVPLGSELGTVTIQLALRETAGRGLNTAALPVPARPGVGRIDPSMAK